MANVVYLVQVPDEQLEYNITLGVFDTEEKADCALVAYSLLNNENFVFEFCDNMPTKIRQEIIKHGTNYEQLDKYIDIKAALVWLYDWNSLEILPINTCML